MQLHWLALWAPGGGSSPALRPLFLVNIGLLLYACCALLRGKLSNLSMFSSEPKVFASKEKIQDYNVWTFYFNTQHYRSAELQTGYTHRQLVEITTRTLATAPVIVGAQFTRTEIATKRPKLQAGLKTKPPNFISPYLHQILTEFHNSFAGTLCSKFAVE